jgi:hypothetical protein
VGTYSGSLASAQVVSCLIPPLALQIGSGAFLNSYDSSGGISVSTISGIMVIELYDIFFVDFVIFLCFVDCGHLHLWVAGLVLLTSVAFGCRSDETILLYLSGNFLF